MHTYIHKHTCMHTSGATSNSRKKKKNAKKKNSHLQKEKYEYLTTYTKEMGLLTKLYNLDNDFIMAMRITTWE